MFKKRSASLQIIDKIIPIRMSVYEEVLGADLVEHSIRHTKVRILFPRYDRFLVPRFSEFLNFDFYVRSDLRAKRVCVCR